MDNTVLDVFIHHRSILAQNAEQGTFFFACLMPDLSITDCLPYQITSSLVHILALFFFFHDAHITTAAGPGAAAAVAQRYPPELLRRL